MWFNATMHRFSMLFSEILALDATMEFCSSTLDTQRQTTHSAHTKMDPSRGTPQKEELTLKATRFVIEVASASQLEQARPPPHTLVQAKPHTHS